MTREEMIKALVAHSVKTAVSEAKHYWLSELFEKGFTGYRNLSRAQLVQELQMRGLEDPDDPWEAPEPDDEDADVDVEEYEDRDLSLPVRARAD